MIGQFFTPPSVARCLFRLAGARPGDRIIDPSCGDGVFVRNAPAGTAVFACEIDPRYASAVREFLPAGNFTAGDALVELQKQFGTFDLAIGNPPYSAQTHLETRPDVLGKFELAAGRSRQCLEILFLELFVKLVRPGGQIAVVLPDGPFSNRPFRSVREWLLRHTHITEIVSLPRNIFSATAAKTNLLLARKRAPNDSSPAQPTWLFQCSALAQLDTLTLPTAASPDPRWQAVQLTDTTDWRPEAHANATVSSRGSAAVAGAANAATIRLGDVFAVRTGFALYGAKREFFEQPAPDRILLLRAKNLAATGGLSLEKNCAYIRRDSEFFRERAVVKPGEIVFVRVGVGCYGRAAVVPADLVAQADDWIHVLTPIAGASVNVRGVVRWMQSPAGRAELLKLAKGVGTLSISKSSLKNLLLPARFLRGPLPEPALAPRAKPTPSRPHKPRAIAVTTTSPQLESAKPRGTANQRA